MSTNFVEGWNELAEFINTTAIEKGWWQAPEDALAISQWLHAEGNCPNAEVREQLIAKLNNLSKRNEGEILALIHSEISEALEGLREGNPKSKKLPFFTTVEEELADAMIRIADYAKMYDLRVAEAMVAKVEYNTGRPFKHGGKAF